MKIKVYVDTKWVGAKEEIEIDTNDYVDSDEQWNEMPSHEKWDLIMEEAMQAIGFSVSTDNEDF